MDGTLKISLIKIIYANKFKRLQEGFFMYSENEKFTELEKPLKEEFSIIYKIPNYRDNSKDEYVKKLFYKDFLIPRIKKIGRFYIEKDKAAINLNGIYGDESLEKYCEQKIKKYQKLSLILLRINHLPEGVKGLLQEQLNFIIDYYSSQRIGVA